MRRPPPSWAAARRPCSAGQPPLHGLALGQIVAPTAGALAATLGQPAAASVPPDWVDAAVASARSLTSRAARLALGQIVAPTAGALARKHMRNMLLGRLTSLAVLSIALAALGGLAWGVRAAGPDEPGAARPGPTPPRPRPLMPAGRPTPARPEKPAAGRKAAVPETVTFRGLVVDPQGRPFAGAALYVVGERLERSASRTVRTTSSPDGRFRFELPGKDFLLEPGQTRLGDVGVVARAPGWAFGLADGSDASRELTVALARDDAPILGRVVDLEGRPIAGASVKVMEVRLPDDGLSGDEVFARAVKVLNAVRPVYGPYAQSIQAAVAEQLDAGLMDMEDSKEWVTLESPFLPNREESGPAPAFIPDATTGPDGRFRITGIGRWRVATLQLDGPTIERTNFDVRTWPGAPIHVRANRNPRFHGPWTVYGATFEHVAGPTRAIEGVVRDRETGRPLADILVYRPTPTARQGSAVRTITDAQGRYRLVGLPLGREGELVAIPACDLGAGSNWFRIDPRLPADRCPPYFPAEVAVEKSPGRSPIHLDIALKRGVRISGRIIDQDTGEPVRGRVTYFDFDDNPHRHVDPDPLGRRGHHFTNVDGIFRLVVPPGPGVLAAYAFGPYVRGAGAEALKDRRPDWLAHIGRGMRFPAQFHSLRWIEPAPGVSSITEDLVVVPAGRR
jgi:hypothetical protein